VPGQQGFAYYRRGQYGEAIADLEAARSLYDEPEPEVLLHLGAAYLKAGEAEKGFNAFRSVLLLAEDERARAAVDSLMTVQRYAPGKKQAFEETLWQERLAAAKPAIGFTMSALDGSAQTFDPVRDGIVLLNFTSPT